MEPKEFLKRFLPDYKEKHRTAFINNAIADKEHSVVEAEFFENYFAEALQNFALKICEAQIILVKNEVMKFSNKKSTSDVIMTIDNCAHPKIEYICQH